MTSSVKSEARFARARSTRGGAPVFQSMNPLQVLAATETERRRRLANLTQEQDDISAISPPVRLNHCVVICFGSSINPSMPMTGVGSTAPAGDSL